MARFVRISVTIILETGPDRLIHARAVDVLMAASQTTVWATGDGICDAERKSPRSPFIAY
jgi:hypothetical protein